MAMIYTNARNYIRKKFGLEMSPNDSEMVSEMNLDLLNWGAVISVKHSIEYDAETDTFSSWWMWFGDHGGNSLYVCGYDSKECSYSMGWDLAVINSWIAMMEDKIPA